MASYEETREREWNAMKDNWNITQQWQLEQETAKQS